MLNYYTSIGMRRLIADVSGSTQALLVTGLIAMMSEVSEKPNEVNINAMLNIFRTLQYSSTFSFNKVHYDEIFSSYYDWIGQDISPSGQLVQLSGANGDDNHQIGDLLRGIVPNDDQSDTKNNNGDKSSNLFKKLPVITTSYEKLLVPLITLHVASQNRFYPARLVKIYQQHSTRNGDKNGPKMIPIDQLGEFLPVLLRAVYQHHCWEKIRAFFRFWSRRLEQSIRIKAPVVNSTCKRPRF